MPMAHGADPATIHQYWGRDGLGQQILDALAAAGKDLGALTVDDVAPADHFHGGGKAATDRLARLAAPAAGDPSAGRRRRAGRPGSHARGELRLSGHGARPHRVLRAGGRAPHRATPPGRPGEPSGRQRARAAVPDGVFDMVWTQNSGMNIADKERLSRHDASHAAVSWDSRSWNGMRQRSTSRRTSASLRTVERRFVQEEHPQVGQADDGGAEARVATTLLGRLAQPGIPGLSGALLSRKPSARGASPRTSRDATEKPQYTEKPP
jgi:hypothetical protein